MTAETRRNILRYGIAIDLVILATGVGLLFPDAGPVLFLSFTLAVVLAAWKCGPQGALTALVLSLLSVWYFFLPAFPPTRLGIFAVVAAVLSGLLILTKARAAAAPAPPVDELADVAPNVVAFATPAVVDDSERIAEEARERERAEREARLRREREEAKRLERERAEAERREREEAERAAREARERAESARRAAEEELRRAEAERREAEARAAREREEAERVAREAKEREEAARAAREAKERAEAERRAAEEELRRAEAERREAEARAAKEREEAERVAREAKEREEAERVAREVREREEAERVAKQREEAERLEREREEAERVAREVREREEAERVAKQREEAERLEREREEAARVAREARERAEAERRAAEEELRRAEAERREAEARAAKEREEAERVAREAREQLEAEKREAEARLAAEREAMRAEHERQLAAEREALRAAASASAWAAEAAPASPAAAPPAPRKTTPAAPKPGLVDTLTGWFRGSSGSRSVNLNTKKIANNRKPTPEPAAARRPAVSSRKDRHPRLLLLERRRGTADAVAPKLKQRAIDVAVVERWVDAVDELFRFRPDALFMDVEHPDFDVAYKTITDQNPKLPIILTGRSAAGFQQLPNVRYASFAVRPYDPDELSRLAQSAMLDPEKLLRQQAAQRAPAPAPAAKPATAPSMADIRPAPKPTAPVVVSTKPATNDAYEVVCISCRVAFDALEADWCSCLTKERTLVCTNCLTCFCKAVPAYKERFWVEAPPRLFERKTAEARRQQSVLPANPEPDAAQRPLVLCVEDDEEIQAIVQRVASNLGYGFIYATNGQDGLNIARLYRPNLILSDAFMPKLDGREMCRLLKEEPIGTEMRMVIMTGLYTDTKYRSEAVKRFHVDDYIAKPVAITDLINILQRHLEGVTGLPPQTDLFAEHRRHVEEHVDERPEQETEADGIALADLLTAEIETDADSPEPAMLQAVEPAKPARRDDAYVVSCVNCHESFDATKTEWCTCVGRDQTLACTKCGGCFCKAPAQYKERFWMDAPPSLFERKMIGSKRSLGSRSNPLPEEVKRPLILLVEDDENVQLIVRTVVTSMGYGFIAGANGQEGLALAREYNPDLILSDAFMPKLDGREMCRLLKEDPATARAKAIIMTGLYTDRKYRNEALDYFKVDDYVAKPLAVDDLIKLFKKHLPQEVQAAS